MRGLLDKKQPQAPSLDKASRICASLGIDFRLGDAGGFALAESRSSLPENSVIVAEIHRVRSSSAMLIGALGSLEQAAPASPPNGQPPPDKLSLGLHECPYCLAFSHFVDQALEFKGLAAVPKRDLLLLQKAEEEDEDEDEDDDSEVLAAAAWSATVALRCKTGGVGCPDDRTRSSWKPECSPSTLTSLRTPMWRGTSERTARRTNGAIPAAVHPQGSVVVRGPRDAGGVDAGADDGVCCCDRFRCGRCGGRRD
ncbi:MAG: hypothetical protein F4X59_17305 [Holophagales bacterium]|nr:hypothetical protein [Holophagales bacterium]